VSEALRVLVVGAGSIGRRHLKNLAALGGASLAVVDADGARARAAAAEHGARVHASIDEALGTFRPDVAVVATPSHLHLAQALGFAEAGVHAFIEKPLAASEEGVARLVAAVRARGLHAMVGCNLRFDDVYRRVRRTLDEQALGPVHAAHFHVGHDLAAWRPGVDYRTVYSARRAEGGGIVLDAIHEIDLALHFFGRARRVLALPRRTGRLDADVEDVADLVVEFASGVAASIHMNYRDPVYRRTVSIAGDAAIVDGDFGARRVELRRREGPPEVVNFPDDRNAMYVREMEHFLAVVRGEARPAATLDEGVRALELALAARDHGPVVELAQHAPPLARVPVVIQARLGSTRLPGKVLKTAAGKTMLAHQVERIRRARLVDQVILATSEAPADRALVDEAERLSLPWFVGSEHDVLSRYVGAVRKYDLPAVVRITADCPLLDPDALDAVIARFLAARPDYCSNAIPVRSVPDGFDVEVIAREALERADRDATERPDREHVTRFLYTHPERFEILVPAPLDRELGSRRWTLDTPADYEFIRSVFERLYPSQPDFRLADILALLTRHPELDTLPREPV
jgi:spore coat polysaccharide biosynthesis protein SpsF